MRGRIRTIKPEALLDEQLWDLEQELQCPVFRAFVGLWTQADREGRFEWRPRALKAAVLPYWDGDFSRVLDALATRGFLVRYAVQGREYGVVRTFKRHQVINNREQPSELPEPPAEPTAGLMITDTSTRAPRVDYACPTPLVHARAEGKGTEGKGTELEPLRDASGSGGVRPISSNRLERIFSDVRKAAGHGAFKLQRSDYDRAQTACQWANDEHAADPEAACRRGIERYLAKATGMEAEKGYPFWGWANDPAQWDRERKSAKSKGAPAPVSTDDDWDAQEARHG